MHHSMLTASLASTQKIPAAPLVVTTRMSESPHKRDFPGLRTTVLESSVRFYPVSDLTETLQVQCEELLLEIVRAGCD